MTAKLKRLPRKTCVGIVTVLILFVAYATRSTAAPPPRTSTLYTAVLHANGFNGTNGTEAALSCYITNVSTVSHIVSAEMTDNSGNTLIEPVPVSLAPGASTIAGLGSSSNAIAFCKITVDGPSSDIRAQIQLLATTNTGALTLAVSPAY